MTTLTHTIQINENPHIGNGTVSAKRVSKSRQYGACVVATATQKTVDDIALGLADHERTVAELTPAVASVLEANGYEHIPAFKNARDAAVSAWYIARDEERRKIQHAVEAATGNKWHFLNAAESAQADAATEARGFVNPDTGVLGTLYKLVHRLEGAKYSVAQIKKQNVQVGDQAVLTWCRDKGLAEKALRAQAPHWGGRFYALTVRTDITVVSK